MCHSVLVLAKQPSCFHPPTPSPLALRLPPSLSSTGVSCLLKSSAVLDPTECELQQLNTLRRASIFMAAVCCNLSHKWGPTVARKSALVTSRFVRMSVFQAGIQALVFIYVELEIFQQHFLSRSACLWVNKYAGESVVSSQSVSVKLCF